MEKTERKYHVVWGVNKDQLFLINNEGEEICKSFVPKEEEYKERTIKDFVEAYYSQLTNYVPRDAKVPEKLNQIYKPLSEYDYGFLNTLCLNKFTSKIPNKTSQ